MGLLGLLEGLRLRLLLRLERRSLGKRSRQRIAEQTVELLLLLRRHRRTVLFHHTRQRRRLHVLHIHRVLRLGERVRARQGRFIIHRSFTSPRNRCSQRILHTCAQRPIQQRRKRLLFACRHSSVFALFLLLELLRVPDLLDLLHHHRTHRALRRSVVVPRGKGRLLREGSGRRRSLLRRQGVLLHLDASRLHQFLVH